MKKDTRYSIRKKILVLEDKENDYRNEAWEYGIEADEVAKKIKRLKKRLKSI